MSDAKEGSVRAISPHVAPMKKDAIVRSATEKDRPTPTVERISDAMRIALVDGKATCLMKL